MIDNIRLSEAQIKDAGMYFSKLKVVTKTDLAGDIEHLMLLSADGHGHTFVFASDDERPKDFYLVGDFDIDIYNRDKLLEAVNILHGKRLTFS